MDAATDTLRRPELPAADPPAPAEAATAATPARAKRIPMSNEVARKVFHYGSVVIPLGVYFFGWKLALAVLAPAAAISVACEIGRAHWPAFNRFVTMLAGFMMRNEEKQLTPGRAVLTGSTWMLISYTATLSLFPEAVAIASFLMLSLCDPTAGLVGRAVGRLKYGPKARTVEGTAAFLVAGAVVAAFAPGLPFWVAMVGATAAAATEAVATRLDDNLVIPLAAAAAMTLALAAVG